MNIVVANNGHKFNAKTFAANHCQTCSCAKWRHKDDTRQLMCSSRCLCGNELPVEEAAARLSKELYDRRVNRARRTITLIITGFYCEGKSMETLYKQQENPFDV